MNNPFRDASAALFRALDANGSTARSLMTGHALDALIGTPYEDRAREIHEQYGYCGRMGDVAQRLCDELYEAGT